MSSIIMDEEADLQERISALVDWATNNGAVLHPSIEVYDDPQTGLSFRVKPTAVAPVAPYETVVSLPSSLSLSYLNAIHGDHTGDAARGPFRADFVQRTPPHVVGRLFLVREFLRGDKSFWWPYIQALPQPDGEESEWALPPFWPEEEAELLEGTNIEIGVEKIRADVQREFSDAHTLLETYSSGDGDEDCIVFAKSLSKTLYHWAYCIFSSRSFRPSLVLSQSPQTSLPESVTIDEFSVLLPLFDIGNHDMTTDVRWDLREDTNVDASSGNLCELKVGKTHQPGDQIFNNYSMKTNAELLLGYGFMIPATEALHNDYTHVRKRTTTTTTNTTAVKPPPASEEYLISRRPLSHPSSVLARSKQSLVVEPKRPLPPILGAFSHVQHDMVWDIFCTLTPPDTHAELIPVSPSEGNVESLRQQKFFSGQVQGACHHYLEQTIAIIQHKVLQELERLNETDMEVVGEDVEFLSRNQKLALNYREYCRHVLEETLGAMSDDEMLKFDDND